MVRWIVSRRNSLNWVAEEYCFSSELQQVLFLCCLGLIWPLKRYLELEASPRFCHHSSSFGRPPSPHPLPLKWWRHLWIAPYLKKSTLGLPNMTYISIHLTSSTMRLIHLMSFLDWIWVSHRGEDKLQRRHPVPQGLLLQPEKLLIQFSTRKQNKKFRNLSIQFFNRDFLLLQTKQEP